MILEICCRSTCVPNFQYMSDSEPINHIKLFLSTKLFSTPGYFRMQRNQVFQGSTGCPTVSVLTWTANIFAISHCMRESFQPHIQWCLSIFLRYYMPIYVTYFTSLGRKMFLTRFWITLISACSLAYLNTSLNHYGHLIQSLSILI